VFTQKIISHARNHEDRGDNNFNFIFGIGMDATQTDARSRDIYRHDIPKAMRLVLFHPQKNHSKI
jgi:hypothetical protein